jgi:GNAT superfamily N-acetyltransferase
LNEITYRTFRNSDPPRILRLWHQCDLGRGAARPSSIEAFESTNYAQPYFDPAGLIVAESEGELIGFSHAGFGFLPDRSAIDPRVGVVCVVMVRPDHRRRGIGRELVRRAEVYLRDRGTESILGGESRNSDPFYYGLYGGSRPSGFLQSDPLADPFFRSLGYEPVETVGVYQRDLRLQRDPVNMRLMNVRRSTELVVAEGLLQPTFWWYTHMGRGDGLRFRLVDRKLQEPVAAVTVVGLDHYLGVWNERVVGLVDMFVREDRRGQGFGQTLLVETLRRLRQELITRAEIHVSDLNPFLSKAAVAAGFERIETGTVYRKVAEHGGA